MQLINVRSLRVSVLDLDNSVRFSRDIAFQGRGNIPNCERSSEDETN